MSEPSVPSPDAQSPGTPLPDLFWTLAVELKELSQAAANLEGLLALWAERTHLEAEVVEQAQATDLLLQRLEALGDFFLTLAHTAPPTARVEIGEALDRLKLHGLRVRLGEPLDAPLAHPAADPGEFELL